MNAWISTKINLLLFHWQNGVMERLMQWGGPRNFLDFKYERHSYCKYSTKPYYLWTYHEPATVGQVVNFVVCFCFPSNFWQLNKFLKVVISTALITILLSKTWKCYSMLYYESLRISLHHHIWEWNISITEAIFLC